MYIKKQRPDWHRLTDINTKNRTAICSICGVTTIKSREAVKPNGRQNWKCCTKNIGKGGQYKQHRKLKCEECGFIPKHKCQLDVHHKDGNHSNDDIKNLQTLCANCHRLYNVRILT